ncbi:hypothetical protein BVC93_04725 [Mycobacterium sp. MS1601]|uniref:lipopolysaccharide biosynthesis protein n=1 Tax=Mycobacterium sp. MS1601 TaxID=1936029 RepID=UPI000979293E|nr:oligosaccharide flippase family protein [Mycobacterium sp. MS1601]AQA01855.1 hypothetical protein BVC93_04725 [Mycobacterium sp. MS1601]
MATSAILSQFLVLASTPILTRIYTPSDFGVLAVFVSILGVVPVIANFRYDIAISLSKDKQESYQTLALCMLSTALCTAVVGVLFGTGLAVQASSSLATIQDYWWLVTIGTFAVGVFTSLNAWVGYAQDFGLVARVKIRQAISSILVQIGLGLLMFGPIGLLVGYVMSQSYGATSFALAVRRSRPSRFGFRDIGRVAWKYRQFFLFAFPAGVINRLGIHLIPVLIGAFYSLSAAGFYLLAQRLVALPTLVIGRSVAQVYTNRLAKDSLAGGVQLLPTYLKTILSLFLAGLLPMSLLAVFSPWIFEVIFGNEWRRAGVFCQILVPAFYAQFIVSPMIQTLNVLGHQKAQLLWDCARLGAIVGVFFLSNVRGLAEMPAIVAISATLCVTYVLQFFLSVWAIRRHDNRIGDRVDENYIRNDAVSRTYPDVRDI